MKKYILSIILLLTVHVANSHELTGKYLVNAQAHQVLYRNEDKVSNKLSIGYYKFKESGLLDYGYFVFEPDFNRQGWYLSDKHPQIGVDGTSVLSGARIESCDKHTRGRFKIPPYQEFRLIEDQKFSVEGNKLTIQIEDVSHEWEFDGNKWIMRTPYTFQSAGGLHFDKDPATDYAQWYWNQSMGYGYMSESLNPIQGDVSLETHFSHSYSGEYHYQNKATAIDNGEVSSWFSGKTTDSIHPGVYKNIPSESSKLYGITQRCNSAEGENSRFCQATLGVNVSPSFQSLVYYHGGNIWDDRTAPYSACWDENESVGGHNRMMFGAWNNGAFTSFVSIEYSYEVDGYPYWGLAFYE